MYVKGGWSFSGRERCRREGTSPLWHERSKSTRELESPTGRVDAGESSAPPPLPRRFVCPITRIANPLTILGSSSQRAAFLRCVTNSGPKVGNRKQSVDKVVDALVKPDGDGQMWLIGTNQRRCRVCACRRFPLDQRRLQRCPQIVAGAHCIQSFTHNDRPIAQRLVELVRESAPDGLKPAWAREMA